MPGHPEWHLAPREMAWEGKSLAEICAQIKDPVRNGGRKVEDLIHHIGTDTLVGWAWAPGFGRTSAPGTQKKAGALVEAWVKPGRFVRQDNGHHRNTVRRALAFRECLLDQKLSRLAVIAFDKTFA